MSRKYYKKTFSDIKIIMERIQKSQKEHICAKCNYKCRIGNSYFSLTVFDDESRKPKNSKSVCLNCASDIFDIWKVITDEEAKMFLEV